MPPVIEDYSFGRIVIDGKTYTSDVKIIGEKIVPNWWRREGHHLYPEDIEDILASGCEVLVVGTGAYGVMKVDPKVKEACAGRGIRLEASKTAQAVKRFNELAAQGAKVAGAFHLTC